MPPAGTTEDENHSPFEGGEHATGKLKDTPLRPLDRGDFQESHPSRTAAPPRMKITPLHGTGAGVGYPEP